MPSAHGSFDYQKFIFALREIQPTLDLIALQDVHARAERIAEVARGLAAVGTPEEGDPHPGAMREDIGIKGEGIDAHGPYVDVGTTEPYAIDVEFGTVNMPAQPFMRPAIAAEAGSGVIPSRLFLAPRSAAAKRTSSAKPSRK